MNVTSTLASLVECLCTQITDAGLPEPCFCGLVPGDAAVFDYAGDCDDKCGMAWVRLVTTYPSVTVGVADTTPGNCAAGLGFDVEIGIVRCLPVGDSEGEPPTPEQYLDAALTQYVEADIMRQAVLCCGFNSHDFIMGSYTPLGPDGGLVGGQWVMSFGA